MRSSSKTLINQASAASVSISARLPLRAV
ncbi:MAG: hypothetical protein JWP77_1303, partial [Polaromonas sp.]|nr:hypothetical protein [Polaromonas sp.]